MKNVKLFFEKIVADEKLQGKIEEIQDNSKEYVYEELIKIAKKLGFKITKEDLIKYEEQKIKELNFNIELGEDELDEEDLENVAGGNAGNNTRQKFIKMSNCKPLYCQISVTKVHDKNLRGFSSCLRGGFDF